MMRGNSSRPVRIRGAAPRYQSEGFRVKFNDLFSSADGYNAGRHPEAFKDEKFKVRGLVPSTNDGGLLTQHPASSVMKQIERRPVKV